MKNAKPILLAVPLPFTGLAADYTNYVRLFSFSGTNGVNPYGSLIGGSDGRLYGTTLEAAMTLKDT